MGKQKGKRFKVKRGALLLLEEIKEELTEQQKLFCLLYTTDKACFGNAAAAYAEAYNLTAKQRKTTARQLGYKLLTNIYIKGFIDSFLSTSFTDLAVDNELAKVIHQNKQLQPKIQAISEYNKLKARIKSDPEPTIQNIFLLLNESQRKRIARRVITHSESSAGALG